MTAFGVADAATNGQPDTDAQQKYSLAEVARFSGRPWADELLVYGAGFVAGKSRITKDNLTDILPRHLTHAGATRAEIAELRPYAVGKRVDPKLRAEAIEYERVEQQKLTNRVLEKAAEDTTSRPALRAVSSLVLPPPPKWLAVGHVPKASVSLLVGDEGLGKSLYWVWLAGFVTTGKPCPEYGMPPREPADVVVVSTEDTALTISERLRLADADLDRVHIMSSSDDGTGSPTFPDHMDVLTESPIRPALVVVDAWADTLPSSLTVRDPQQARQALHVWKEYAETTGAAVLLMSHTNRVQSANARDKYALTGELRKKARHTLFAQLDTENSDCLLIGAEKSNIGPTTPAVRFRVQIEQVRRPSDDDPGTQARLVFAGSSEKTARELIADAFHGDGADATESDEAEMWLEDYLAENGKTPSREVKAAAKAAGIRSDRTLQRAAKKIGVVYVSEGKPRTTSWVLPGGAAMSADEGMS
ncbi:AAA family ATPase [Nocardia cyriacigeorgica]